MRHLALQIHEQTDKLTGLDAPEIFYKFLEKALASETRNNGFRTSLVRFRLSIVNEGLITRERSAVANPGHTTIQSTDEPEDPFDSESSLAVALFAKFLSGVIRSNETVTRVGEMTFLLLAHVKDEGELLSLENRFKGAISQINLKQGSCDFAVDIDGFIHQPDEDMLDFLQRADV